MSALDELKNTITGVVEEAMADGEGVPGIVADNIIKAMMEENGLRIESRKGAEFGYGAWRKQMPGKERLVTDWPEVSPYYLDNSEEAVAERERNGYV